MHVLQMTGLVLLWSWTGFQAAMAASCPNQVSTGDRGVGISAVDAPACPTAGGVGCFGGGVACRFCKTFNTPQSSHLDECTTSTPTLTPAPIVTPKSVAPSGKPTPTTTNNNDCVEDLVLA